ncbi:hypothetical protein ACH4TX_38020 [Streptomyces sp. NPDC021098]|uniref:hypothetical protein n=1 Tax=unclassified Streptomyces TaxID=2593676 RepID=UPI0037AAC20F
MNTGMRRRAATTAATLTMSGALGVGVMTPMAYGAGHGPCYDGRCTITVSKPRSIAVNSHTFGFGKLKVTHISSRTVKFSATSGGISLSGSTSPGGTVKLNNLKIWVKSASGHKAKLALFPTR